jgi:hypothetical protein
MRQQTTVGIALRLFRLRTLAIICGGLTAWRKMS